MMAIELVALKAVMTSDRVSMLGLRQCRNQGRTSSCPWREGGLSGAGA